MRGTINPDMTNPAVKALVDAGWTDEEIDGRSFGLAPIKFEVGNVEASILPTATVFEVGESAPSFFVNKDGDKVFARRTILFTFINVDEDESPLSIPSDGGNYGLSNAVRITEKASVEVMIFDGEIVQKPKHSEIVSMFCDSEDGFLSAAESFRKNVVKMTHKAIARAILDSRRIEDMNVLFSEFMEGFNEGRSQTFSISRPDGLVEDYLVDPKGEELPFLFSITDRGERAWRPSELTKDAPTDLLDALHDVYAFQSMFDEETEIEEFVEALIERDLVMTATDLVMTAIADTQ